MTRKPWSHVRISIYRTWAFVEYKAKRVCLHYLIGLSLLLVSLHCSKKFSSRYPGFSPSSKSSVSKLKIRPGMVDKGTLCGYATSDSLFLMFLNDAYARMDIFLTACDGILSWLTGCMILCDSKNIYPFEINCFTLPSRTFLLCENFKSKSYSFWTSSFLYQNLIHKKGKS